MSSRRSRSGGDPDGPLGETRVQVGPEPALLDQAHQLDRRGRDHAHVDLDVLGPADRSDLPGLEDPEQRGLERERHLGDLVEQQGPAVRRPEQPRVVGHGARERPADVPEQIAREQRLGERAAVDPDERSGAAAALVDQARHDLLAGPGLARDHDAVLACGDRVDAADHRLHRQTRPQHLGPLVPLGGVGHGVDQQRVPDPEHVARPQRALRQEDLAVEPRAGRAAEISDHHLATLATDLGVPRGEPGVVERDVEHR